MLTRRPDDEARAVDVGVREAGHHLPVGSAENVINIDGEAHSASRGVERPQ